MLALIQRVTHANVRISNKEHASIDGGLLILCGFEADDTIDTAKKLLNKCLDYRIFSDSQNKMNLSVRNIDGAALIVPQFTLVADTKRGLRPSFSKGMSPEKGLALFEKLQQCAPELYNNLCFGCFGADMQVSLCNDGPITFLLSST